MRNDGSKLRSLIKSKGFDLVGLAKVLNITTAAIQKDLNNKQITRRALVKYVPVLLTSVDEFLTIADESYTKVSLNTQTATHSETDYNDLQQKYIELQARFIELQDRHLKLTERFFPNAAQLIALG